MNKTIKGTSSESFMPQFRPREALAMCKIYDFTICKPYQAYLQNHVFLFVNSKPYDAIKMGFLLGIIKMSLL